MMARRPWPQECERLRHDVDYREVEIEDHDRLAFKQALERHHPFGGPAPVPTVEGSLARPRWERPSSPPAEHLGDIDALVEVTQDRLAPAINPEDPNPLGQIGRNGRSRTRLSQHLRLAPPRVRAPSRRSTSQSASEHHRRIEAISRTAINDRHAVATPLAATQASGAGPGDDDGGDGSVERPKFLASGSSLSPTNANTPLTRWTAAAAACQVAGSASAGSVAGLSPPRPKAAMSIRSCAVRSSKWASRDLAWRSSFSAARRHTSEQNACGRPGPTTRVKGLRHIGRAQ